MSHKLKEDGPYGFAPEGPKFDRTVAEMFAHGNLEGLFGLDAALCDGAAECGLRSFQIMAGALEATGEPFASELLSYEGPFGVGYAVAMPGGDLGKLAVGEEARVLTYLSVTENGIALFGFLSEEERALFEKLIGVSKVGPKMALAALSTFSPAELADAIASQDIARVSHIPGVGKKTAERIILELKGTLEGGMASLFSQGEVEPARNLAVQGATEALLSMGFTSAEAEVALRGAPEDAGEGALLQYALKRLGSR